MNRSPITRWFVALAVAISMPAVGVLGSGPAPCVGERIATAKPGRCCCGEGCRCGPACSAQHGPTNDESQAPVQVTQKRGSDLLFASVHAPSLSASPVACEAARSPVHVHDGVRCETLVSQHICLRV